MLSNFGQPNGLAEVDTQLNVYLHDAPVGTETARSRTIFFSVAELLVDDG